LYGYPAADVKFKRGENETFFPRSSDEFYQVEKILGSVRLACIINDKEVNFLYN